MAYNRSSLCVSIKELRAFVRARYDDALFFIRYVLLPKNSYIDFYVKTMYFYNMAKIWDAITADDLPTDDLKWIATSIGLDAAKKIWRRFAGNHVACPARMTPSAVRRYMKDNYDKTIHQIAFETGLSERTIYRYMSYSPSQEKDQKQISLF